jgi:hypothetical protein
MFEGGVVNFDCLDFANVKVQALKMEVARFGPADCFSFTLELVKFTL